MVIAPLANRLHDDANVMQVAAANAAIWREIEAALTPVMGRRAVAALYRRSLYLTSAYYPWLASAHTKSQEATDTSGLESLLARQGVDIAVRGSAALLQTFHDLVVSLIGASLVDRLLGAVWSNSLSGPPPQDITS